MSSKSTPSVRSQLIGAWELASYTSQNVDDPSDTTYPMTENCTGIIMYTPDGYMSAQMQIPGRTPFAANSDSEGGGGPKQPPGAAEGFFAYTGRFYLDEESGDQEEPILMHQMQISSYMDWLGNTQRRVMRFTEEGGQKYLNLGPEKASVVGGTSRMSALKWRRLEDNQAARPG